VSAVLASQFVQIDLPALMAGALAAVCCGLLGNFLVLRRLSLMGDAISHAVLPGIIAAFLVAGTRTTIPILIGAAIAGVLTTVLVELVCKLGKVETGASMGAVFSVLFALGVLMMEQAAARSVDLDADCILYGQLEDILWLEPTGWAALASPAMWGTAPREVSTLLLVAGLCALFVAMFFKELRIAAFDPGLATSLGINATAMHYFLMIFVAIAAVASFEAVGSILVIAMLICPAATARMLTDRLGSQILVSLSVALAASVGGYFLAAFAPAWLPLEHSLSAAGMMTVVAGVLLTLAIIFSPRHGVVARQMRRLRLAVQIAREDLLAMLWRLEEAASQGARAAVMAPAQAVEALGGGLTPRLAAFSARRLGLAERDDGAIRLTRHGRDAARSLVRTHRLWETYLVREMGLRPDHVHRTAMDLEHVTTERMDEELREEAHAAKRDPHGRPIPD